MDDFALMARPAPTPQRPLLGQTLLVVEDSRFASEAVRLLALRSGARIRRADCIASAERHLATYRPGVAIVDLGLPDGSGLTLIERLDGAGTRPLVVMATSGRDDAETEALAAGADGFLPKPVESLAAFQSAILSHMPEDACPRGPRVLPGEAVAPDPLAMREDLVRARHMLTEEQVAPAFVAAFLGGVARTGHDRALLDGAERAMAHHGDPRPLLRSLIAERLGSASRL